MNMNRTSLRSYGSNNTQNTNTEKMTLDRTDSSVTKLCDLHVYKVPPELWRDNLNNVLNNAVTETVSVGIIRVPEELHLAEVRAEVSQQLTIRGVDLVPKDFVFLRSVGRSLTTLRGKQEQQLKAKHFLPPVAYAPELYILEVTPEVREALAISDTSSPLSQRASPSHTTSHHNGYRGNSNSVDIHKPSVLLSRPGYKRAPHAGGSVDTSTREFSHNPVFQSLPNNHNLSKPSHHHNNPHVADSNNHPYSTHSENSNKSNILSGSSNNEDQDKHWPDSSNHKIMSGWPGQATHTQTTNPSFRQPPHTHTINPSYRQPPHTQTTNTFHRQAPHTQSPGESIDKVHHHWSAGNGHDNSPDGSRAGGFSQDDLNGRRHRGQNGGVSRHAKGNLSDRLNSENDSEEEEPGRRTGYGGTRNARKTHEKHSDEDEHGLSSDEEPATSRRRQKIGQEKNHLLKNIEDTKMSRQDLEKERADLMRKAKQIQRKTTQYRNEARDVWKKKYFEEKKRTAPLEDTSNILQNELEALHRKQISILEGPREKHLRLVDGSPSEKSNHVIQCAKLRHEIEDLSRRVEMARMKLTSEMKLRVQAQTEMKAVRSEAMQNRLALRASKASHGNTAAMIAAK